MRRIILIIALAFVAACGRPDPQPSAGAGRSGFWTSRQPAKGGAYRYRLMGIGVGIVIVTGGVMIYLVKRASKDRAIRTGRDRSRSPRS